MLGSWGNTLTQMIIVCVSVFITIHLILSPKTALSKRGGRVTLAGTTPLEASFFSDLRDKRAHRWSLADAFFIASGIRDEPNLERARSWLKDLVNEARVALKPHRGVSAKADHLLRWLHKRALSNYQAHSTSALDLIRNGRFNCLSSCILYGMIGEELGLHIRGIIVDQHAFCRVYQKPQTKSRRSMNSRAGGWDVETTTPLGFNPGRSVQLDRAVVSVPRHRYRNRREISLFEMIGLIYTNHVGLTRAYPTIEDRLLAYQKAALFFPRDPVIQHNVMAAHTQLIASSIDQGRWESAVAYLSQLHEVNPQGKEYAQLWISLLDRHLTALAPRGLNEVINALNNYREETPHLPKAVWSLQEARFYGRAAAALISRGEESSGMEHLIIALKSAKRGDELSQRASRQVRGQLQTLRHNSLVPIKNLIIATMNAQNAELASRLNQIAMRYLPRDRDLQGFKKTLLGAQRGSRSGARSHSRPARRVKQSVRRRR